MFSRRRLISRNDSYTDHLWNFWYYYLNRVWPSVSLSVADTHDQRTGRPNASSISKKWLPVHVKGVLLKQAIHYTQIIPQQISHWSHRLHLLTLSSLRNSKFIWQRAFCLLSYGVVSKQISHDERRDNGRQASHLNKRHCRQASLTP